MSAGVAPPTLAPGNVTVSFATKKAPSDPVVTTTDNTSPAAPLLTSNVAPVPFPLVEVGTTAV